MSCPSKRVQEHSPCLYWAKNISSTTLQMAAFEESQSLIVGGGVGDRQTVSRIISTIINVNKMLSFKTQSLQKALEQSVTA